MITENRQKLRIRRSETNFPKVREFVKNQCFCVNKVKRKKNIVQVHVTEIPPPPQKKNPTYSVCKGSVIGNRGIFLAQGPARL